MKCKCGRQAVYGRLCKECYIKKHSGLQKGRKHLK